MSTHGTPHIYAEGLNEATWRALPDHERCDCGDCTWRGRLEDTNIIRDIHERMSEGDPMASGECPECGALANSAAMHAQWEKERIQTSAARAILAIGGAS